MQDISETHRTLLNDLARLRGLGEAYYDHRGELRYFDWAARVAILKSMGLPVDDEQALRASLATEHALGEAHRRQGAAAASNQACFQPDYLRTKKSWGLGIQLYALRSKRNWGIGDFGDLQDLIAYAAPLGCDVIGLNPLHALFPADPLNCGPYSPSSRLFLNILYVAIDIVPEFTNCTALQTLWSQSTFQAALEALRSTPTVMYEQATTLKLSALRLLYADFVDNHLTGRATGSDSARGAAFKRFVADRGDSLRLHAIFDALDAQFRQQCGGGWQRWPIEYRDPKSKAVTDFVNDHGSDVEFFMFAQWLADEQLAAAQKLAREKGMKIGLYGDLAVGSNPDGSEVWANQSLYVLDAAVGAPPDPLALNGQDWGVPPQNPHALRAQNFRPFVDLLRANMRHAGALRIDHVMSLFRLWWVPRGFSSVLGVYVHYPLAELVDCVVRESHATQCLIIGEDLGTVPDEVRDAMARHELFHYKVLLFEKRSDGSFKSGNEYPHHAVATATTHDLPPLKAWWNSDDLVLRETLRLYPSTQIAQHVRDERGSDRYALIRALCSAELWHWSEHEPLPGFSPSLARAIHVYLGQTDAALTLVQLEDLLGITDPVNVPGTHTEHANWQRKITLNSDDIFRDKDVREHLLALNRARIEGAP